VATETERPEIKREISELSLLLELSETLGRSIDLRDTILPLFKTMERHMGMLRGTLSLVNHVTGQVLIEVAHGLTAAQKERGRYRSGEGVTGRVVQTGQVAVVPRIADEPLFLDRTGARKGLPKEDISFICVPIRSGQHIMGALSVDRLTSETVSYEENIRLLSIIASMIAQAVRMRQEIHNERQSLLEENERLQKELKDHFHPANIIGASAAMHIVYDLISQVAQSNTTVLIRGESGTGKELVANSIHYTSTRTNKPFIKVNCAALPETILESELFGHDKGAFTGAIADRKGRFELANGGSIFLDEIGDLSPSTQM